MKKFNRRLMCFEVSPATLSGVLVNGKLEVSGSDIPNGAEFLSAWYDFSKCTLVIVLRHRSFENVPEGDHIPVYSDTIRIKKIPRDR